MINYELLKDVLTMAILNSLIITSLVQRIKEALVIKCSRICIIVSFITSLVIFFKFLRFEVFSFIME